MGDVEVPVDALWRAQTQRAVQNFPISGRPLPPTLIHALVRIKAAAARTNADLDVIAAEQRDAIVAAVAEIVDGRHDEQFPIDVFQTGSGTSTNMNVNEVISSLTSRAGVECHPNDVVNASQSSNDTFPSAIHVAAVLAAAPLDEAIAVLADALTRKAEEYADAVKSGRTHLMDATPVTLGQELGGYAATVAYARERLAVGPPPRPRAAPRRHRRRHRHQHPAGVRRADHRTSQRRHRASRSPRPATTSRRRAPRTRWSSSAARSRPTPSGWSRSATTCAGWAAARPPAWPRSTCRTSSRGRASCPARSTR